MVRKGDAITTAIRADFAITDARSGNTQVLGEIPLPPNPYGLGGVSGILNFIGEVTPQGNFLFPAISALINPFTFQIEQYTVYIGQIDVNNHGNGANVTYVPLTIDPSCDPYMEACVEAFRAYALNPAGREPSGGIQDWTLSPDGNSLYAFLGIENGLLRIDLPSRTAFCTPGPASNLAFTGTVGAQTDEFGGMYFDNNRLIGWQVDRGRLFEINPSTGALSLISSSFRSITEAITPPVFLVEPMITTNLPSPFALKKIHPIPSSSPIPMVVLIQNQLPWWYRSLKMLSLQVIKIFVLVKGPH
ncbi:MAG: hypothetical protein IPF52_08930 [Saprospiraceae bacterium]|nr:hypothetical protein [Saprospiraceae bacterium]